MPSAEEIQELLSRCTPEEVHHLDSLLQEYRAALNQNSIDVWFPDEGPLSWREYRKHYNFWAAGPEHVERCFMAANRIGKTVCGGYEATCHLAGEYPDWWPGLTFDTPTHIWIAGDTAETVRDIIQPLLFGERGNWGTGLIRARDIDEVRMRRGNPDAIESAWIRHPGGFSSLLFKSYEQGRKSFQGTHMDLIWMDEEPSMAIFSECQLRVMATNREGSNSGSLMCTFTPLLGMSEVVLYFMPGGRLPADA